jgi:hypothetical protein
LSIRALWQSYQQSNLVAKREELVKQMNFTYKYLFHILKGSLTCRKIYRNMADDFTSPRKEGVLWIFIKLKNSSLLAEFLTREPWVQRQAR